jgi:hypothetical protein
MNLPQSYQRFAEVASKLNLDGPTGTLTQRGITIGYNYANGMLQLSIVKKPPFATQQYCEDLLDSLFS